MCRLFGYKGSLPCRLSFFLADASNSLMKQAVMDSRNISNSQGWGVGFYQDRKAYMQKRASAASFDFNFKFLIDYIATDSMIAHVREATVGEISDHNSHPFMHGNWLFCHNGTVQEFDLLRLLILKKIGPELSFEIKGTTDSEYLFYLFISKLAERVPDISDYNIDNQTVLEVFLDTLNYINLLSENLGIEEPNKLNILLTNGKIMLASRFGNTLYLATREKALNQEVKLYKDYTNLKITFDCKYETYCQLKNDSVMIASEQINKEDNWQEVPDHTVIMIDERLGVSIVPI